MELGGWIFSPIFKTYDGVFILMTEPEDGYLDNYLVGLSNLTNILFCSRTFIFTSEQKESEIYLPNQLNGKYIPV